jgi:hypothetical protein
MHWKDAYPLQFCGLVFLSESFQLLFLLHCQVRELLDFSFIETIDDGVLSLSYKNFLHLNQESIYGFLNDSLDAPSVDP